MAEPVISVNYRQRDTVEQDKYVLLEKYNVFAKIHIDINTLFKCKTLVHLITSNTAAGIHVTEYFLLIW